MVHKAGDWPWSSYRAIVGLVTSPSWLATDFILSSFATKKVVAIKTYIKFVEEGKNQPSHWTNLKNQVFLGSDAFVEATMAGLDSNEHLTIKLQPLKRRMPKPLVYYRQQNTTRDKAIDEAYQSGGYTMKEIGKHFGLGESMVSRLLKNQDSSPDTDTYCEGLGIEVDLSLPSTRVIRSLEQIIEWRGKPAAIRCDNGPEYISETLINWANKHHITLMFIQPGKPTQNAYIERFNRTARHEWLVYTCLNLLSTPNYWQLNGFGRTMTKGRIQALEASHPGIY